jgi:DNA-binding NarL/FixJ family response regulator
MPDAAGPSVHILLLDDHALFREGVSRLLAAEPGFHVIGQCGTIQEALQVLREQLVDIVLLDFDLGEQNGREFIREAGALGFKGRILVVTAGVDRETAAGLIRSGISGLFLKRDSASSLAMGIREVLAGRVWLFHDQLQPVLTAQDRTKPGPRPRPLTDREQQVVAHVFEGLSNKEIATRIGVSESSVKATLQQLFAKTGVRTRSQLVRIILEQHQDQI